MSTVDTFANVTAMPLAYDLIEPLAMRKATRRQVAVMARVISVVAIILAVIYAYNSASLGDVYYLSSGILSAAIAVPAIAVFWKRANTPGVILGSLAGVAATLLMYRYEYKVLDLWNADAENYAAKVLPAWLAGGAGYLYIGAGVVAAVVILVVVSLVTPRPAAERLAAVDELPVDGAAPIEAVSEHAQAGAR